MPSSVECKQTQLKTCTQSIAVDSANYLHLAPQESLPITTWTGRSSHACCNRYRYSWPASKHMAAQAHDERKANAHLLLPMLTLGVFVFTLASTFLVVAPAVAVIL